MGDTTTETPDAPPNAEHDKLRAAVRTDGRPMTVISQEIGLAYGTFSVWMGGKYAGDNERIAQAVAKWLATRGARAAARRPRGKGALHRSAALRQHEPRRRE